MKISSLHLSGILFTILFFAFSIVVVSQNVGIGTTSPVEKLHVTGKIQLDANYPFVTLNDTSAGNNAGIAFKHQGNSQAFIYYIKAADNLLLSNSAAGARNDLMIKDDGKVGIGTDSPDQQLEVAGNIKLGDNIMVEGNDQVKVFRNLASYGLNTYTAPGAFVIHTNMTNSHNCMWSVTVKGYIYGSSGSAGTLFEVTMGAYNNNGHAVYTYKGENPLEVRTAIDGSNVVLILGDEGETYGYPYVTVSEYRMGLCTTSDETKADGWSITQETSLGYTSITALTNVSNNYWTENGSDIYFNSGQVGIGVSSPSYDLHVANDNGTDNTATIYAVNYHSGTGTRISALEGHVNSTATTSPGAGVVGVHDVSTGNSAGVKGETYSNTGRGVYGYAVHSTGTNYGIYGKTSSSNGFAGYFEGGKNYFEGNVGIGTTIPDEKLQINNGNIKVVHDSPSIWLNATNTTNGFGSIFWQNNGTDRKTLYLSNNSNGLMLWDFVRGGMDLAVTDDGYIGIGTSDPSQKLHIEYGNVQISNSSTFLYMNATDVTGGQSSIMFQENGVNKKRIRFDNNTDKLLFYDIVRGDWDMAITSDGDIGIGTTSPAYKLEVSGNIKSGADFITNSTDGVINAGGGRNAFVNVISDVASPTLSYADGDEDLYIEDDLELGTTGQGYKPGGGSWASVSDARLKKDITPYTDGLNQLLQIEPVFYKYNGTLNAAMDNGKSYIGVLAQDIQKVAPYTVEELQLGRKVSENEDGTETVIDQGTSYLVFDGSALTYMLINSVKEQQQIIEDQQSQIDEMAERLDLLMLKIEALGE